MYSLWSTRSWRRPLIGWNINQSVLVAHTDYTVKSILKFRHWEHPAAPKLASLHQIVLPPTICNTFPPFFYLPFFVGRCCGLDSQFSCYFCSSNFPAVACAGHFLLCSIGVWKQWTGWTTGLDYWTRLLDWPTELCLEQHNNIAGFVFRVMELKFKFFGFRGRVPKQSCEHWWFR